MKKLVFLTTLFFSITSCDREKTTINANDNIVEFNANELLAQFNNVMKSKWRIVIPELKIGFQTAGELRITMDSNKSVERLNAAFDYPRDFGNGEGVHYRRLDCRVERRIELPEKMKNTEILYPGNQLNVKYPNSDEDLNLYVNNRKINKAPQLDTHDGSMLRIITGNKSNSWRSGP